MGVYDDMYSVLVKNPVSSVLVDSVKNLVKFKLFDISNIFFSLSHPRLLNLQ